MSLLTRTRTRTRTRRTTGRRRWTLPASVAVGVTVVALAVVALWPRSADAPPVAPPPLPADAGAPVLTVEPVDLDALIPADALWTLDAGPVAVPVSATAGPFEAGGPGGIRSGFAHGASGAVFAAAWFHTQWSVPGADQVALVDQRVVRWQGWAGFRAAAVSFAQERENRPPSDSVWQLSAVRLVTYTGSTATVELVTQRTRGANPGVMLLVSYALAFTGGDWLIVPSVDGGPVQYRQIEFLDPLYLPLRGV